MTPDSSVRSGGVALSQAQRQQLKRLVTGSPGFPSWCQRHECWNLSPRPGEDRTFDVLERRGLVERCRIEAGCSYWGYRISESGRATLHKGNTNDQG